MARPKGSKNKKKTVKTPRIGLPAPTMAILTALSEDSGLPLSKVIEDACLEGAAELRSETYAGLIEFNKRRGIVTYERATKTNAAKSQRVHEAKDFEEVTGADQERYDTDHEFAGLPGPDVQDSGFPGPEEGPGRPREMGRSFADRVRDAIEHVETGQEQGLGPEGDEPREIPF